MTVVKEPEYENAAEDLRKEIRSAAAKQDIDALVQMPREALELRRAEAAERLETRSNRLVDEDRREPTEREQQLSRADAVQITALDAALLQQERVAVRMRQLDEAMQLKRPSASPWEVQAPSGQEVGHLFGQFAELEQRALRGEGGRVRFSLEDADRLELFMRSTTTALAGAQHVTPVQGPGGGIWLPRESGAPNERARPGTRLEAGVYGANTAVAVTAEGATKPTLDPASLATSTVSPYAVTSNVTIQSEEAGSGISQFTWAGTRKVRRSVNDAFTSAMVTAGGTARAFATSAVISLDGAIAFAMAETSTVPSLIICADTLFTALATSGGGNNSMDAFPAFRGIRLVPSTLAALAGNALVIDGSGLIVSLSEIEVRTQPQVISNSTDAVVEAWFAVASRGANAVVLQDCTTP